MSLRIRPLTRDREGAWEAFVQAEPPGTIFHSLSWRDVLLRTFRHDARYLIAEDDGGVVGVLPLVGVRSIFFGRSLVSVPFGVYGGILAKTAAATQGLVLEARRISREFGAQYAELRHLESPPGIELPASDLHATFVRTLPADPSAVLNSIPRKARAEVRKAKDNPELEVDINRLSVAEFHGLFAENKRKLGSPVFPRSLFANLKERLGRDCVMLCIRHRGRAVAAVMSFVWKNTYMAYYSGASEEANEVSANNLMYCASMEDAASRGLSIFDFGRSRRDTGAFAFKKNQGFEPRGLAYHFVLEPGESLPSVNASNPRYDLAKAVFRRLPAFAAEKLGSFVVKRMPV